MIEDVHLLLRRLLLRRVDQLVDESQISFEPPNAAWRSTVSNLTVNSDPVNALDVYLVDLRERRDVRSTAVETETANGLVMQRHASPWVDLHYVISAWTPQEATEGAEPTLLEHELLAEVVAVLLDEGPLVARDIYTPSPLPSGFPAELAEAPLPTTVLPVAGFEKVADFWSTMDWHWKPVAYLLVAAPVRLVLRRRAGIVTTRVASYATTATREPGTPLEQVMQILGTVLDPTHPLPDGTPAPVAGARVSIGAPAGPPLHSTTSDDRGRYTFGSLAAGTYRVTVSATGVGVTSRDVQVPAAEYDVSFP